MGHNRLRFINRGVATRMGVILVAGKFWGDDIILNSELLRDRVPAVTLTYTEVLSVSRVVLMGIATEFPSESRLIRMFALKRALVRAMRLFRLADASLKDAHLSGRITFGQVVREVAKQQVSTKDTNDHDLNENAQSGFT